MHSFLFFSKRFKKFDWAEGIVSRGIAASAGTTWWVFCWVTCLRVSLYSFILFKLFKIHLSRVSFSFQTLISTHLPFLYSDQLFFYDSNDEWFHLTVFLFLFLSFVRSLDICVSCLLTYVNQCRLRFLATIVLRLFTFFHVWGHLEYPFVELLF